MHKKYCKTAAVCHPGRVHPRPGIQNIKPGSQIKSGMTPNQQGYIALTSIILVSLLLLTITTVLSTTNYFSRYIVLENEYKERSSSLAEACADFALAKLIASSSYTGNETATIGGSTCLVNSVTAGGFPKTISTTGTFPQTGNKKSYTNLAIVVDSNINIISWKQCLTTSSCP